ncbi:MAG: hypothetical protein OEU92_29625, partial [Alphaproteobacteria bacterium]|nr:hypothetical protein [Alphaproteobacteria bacterium]
IEVRKAGHTLPCEVVAEDDRGERAVLYSAQYDRDYCPARIEKTKDELEQDGWSCEKTSEQNVVQGGGATDAAGEQQAVRREEAPSDGSGGALIASNGKAIVTSRECRFDDALRRIRIEVEDPERGKPCELIYWADGDQSKPGQLLWRAEHDAAFCPNRLNVIVNKWIAEGWRCDRDDRQTAAVDTPERIETQRETVADQGLPAQQAEHGEDAAAPATDPTLEAIIAADAERIGEWMEVEPAIEIAARGDLNDDGSDDAVVFLAYQSDQAAYRQYLMSYLVAGDGYELASVKLLTGVSPPPGHARVDQIVQGVIWLTLPDEDGSTSAQTGYRLRDQQLVEVDPKAPESVDN